MGWCCAVRKDCDMCCLLRGAGEKGGLFKVFEQFPEVDWWSFRPAHAETSDLSSVL